MLSIWGKEAGLLLDQWSDVSVADLANEDFVSANLNGTSVIIARTHEPMDGFNLIVARDELDRLVSWCEDHDVKQLDEQVYNLLRVEAGIPVFGREISDAYNPLEAGLKSIISFNKGCYIGQEVIARLDTYQKVKQNLVGVSIGRMPEADDDPLVIACGRDVGVLTSWVDSPTYGPIGLGYIQTKALKPNLMVDVLDTKGKTLGKVVELPFCR